MEKHFLTLFSLILIALGHIFIRKIGSHSITRTHHWLSFGAGASVAYVFVHVFPEIGILQQQITGNGGHNPGNGFIAEHLYLVALGGVSFLYFVDCMETRMYDEKPDIFTRHKYYMPIFFINLALYLLYNLMISYFVTQRMNEGIISIMLITAGLMLHFVVLNLNFVESYGDLYDKYVRWFVSAALFGGWILGITIDVPIVVEVTIFSFIGGIITYIALKNELAQTRNRAPFYFFAGAVIFTLIILAIPYFGDKGSIHL